MTDKNQEQNKQRKYLIKPWAFGIKSSLEDRIIFATSKFNFIFGAVMLPVIWKYGVNESARNMGIDETIVTCGLIATTLIAHTIDKIQTTGLTYKSDKGKIYAIHP